MYGGSPHSHSHSHATSHAGHAHADPAAMGDAKLMGAVAANMALTAGQVAGGLISGSRALVAAALHDFSDAAALLLALVARKIGRKPADAVHSFGYRRAELIAALINMTVLVVPGLFLIYETVWRLLEPTPILGWIVVIMAGLALAVDVATALLTARLARRSINVKAAFIHNLADAGASLAVIVGGSLILLDGWVRVDAVLTMAIALYVLWQGLAMTPQTIRILMEGAPEEIHRPDEINAMGAVGAGDLARLEAIKAEITRLLAERFEIDHSTLEFERAGEACAPRPGLKRALVS